jgi:hypothetical protein
MQTYLSDKMPPPPKKKGKIKKLKKWDLTKLENSYIIIPFFGGGGHYVTKTSLLF